MRILITNSAVALRSGTELYVRDLATGLLAHGHSPVVYAPTLGPVARELREQTVPVTDSLDTITHVPELIHGQHNLQTMTALLRFPGTPAVYVVHDNLSRTDVPPHFPRILRYVAVDETCRDRLVSEYGIPEDRVRVVLNSVDLSRFEPREPLPARPRRALIFSNASSFHYKAVRDACARTGLALDVIGHDSSNVSANPEKVLRDYDIVFAKARCAMEAMAVGAAVVLCDFRGVGPMVTSGELDQLRRLNFGHRTLRSEVDAGVIAAEIARYDAADAGEVSRRLRAVGSFELMLSELEAIYAEVLDEYRASPPADAPSELRAASRYLHWLTLRLNEDRAAIADAPIRRVGKYLRQVPLIGRVARSIDRRFLGTRS